MKYYSCVIPVAGLSSRMEDFKPLLKMNGKTMIEHTISTVIKANVGTCTLVLGYKGESIQKTIPSYPSNFINYVYNSHYQTTDMLYSIQLGLKKVQSISTVKGAFILPGDMPKVSSSTLINVARTLEAQKALVVFPVYQGKKKHPPLIDHSCFEYIINFKGEGGLRKALEKFENETHYIEVADFGICLDADTKEEFENILKYDKKVKLL